MISPTPGRIVWFRPNNCFPSINHYSVNEPLAAMIVHVWHDRMVNLVVYDSSGAAVAVTSCVLRQSGDPVPQGYYAEWMPYQIGQARKEEVKVDPPGALA